MAAVAHIALAEISARSETGGSVSLMDAVPVRTTILRSQAEAGELVSPSVATSFEADGANQFWRITALTSVWVSIGTDPVAEPEGEGCWYVPLYSPALELAAKPGQKVAICQ